MQTLIILNDPPYGTERAYNGLRLALALAKLEGSELRLCLMSDAVWCARGGQTTPAGYYNIERMLRGLVTRGVPVGACGTCMDARGVTDADLLAGVHRSSMDELAAWTLWADKVVTF